MNDLVRFAQGVQTATGKKRGRHPVFNSRMFYPYKEELRLQVALKAEITRYIAEAYAVAVNGEVFSDDLETLANFGGDLPEDFRSEVSAIGRAIGRKVSESVARSSEMIVGKPYYPPNAKDEIYRTWEANFQTLCKSAESDAKKEISRIVSTAKNEGWNGRQLEKAIKGELEPKFRHRAELIARTESAKLNGSVTRATYREMGCRYYVWMATMDERTRPDHQAMNGVICSVDDPTVYYTENPDDPLHPVEHPRTSEMCHLHPGDDFQCRCTSVAWDPEIDGQYEIKERPEESEESEEKEPTPLDKAREETSKAEARAEKAEMELEGARNETKNVKRELSEANRALRLQKAAEKRHNRNQAQIDKIQERWNIHNVKLAGIIETEYAAKDTKLIKDVADVQKVIDRYIAKFPKETEYSRIHVATFNKPPTLTDYVAMQTSRKLEYIGFNKAKSSLIGNGPSAFKDLVNAFQKIQRGKKLSFDEEYAIESFYHEILHSKAKQYVVLKQHGQGDFKRTAMETINQFVSRHDYADFIRNMGGRVYNQADVLDNGGGYRNWVKILREFIKAKGIDETQALNHFRDKLLNGRYDELDSVLYDFFKKKTGTTRNLGEVLREFEQCGKPDDFIKFLETKNNNPSP